MPASTFRQIYDLNLAGYAPDATETDRVRARDAKRELFRALEEGVDAETWRRIEREGFGRGDDGKFRNGVYTIHPHPDALFCRVLEGSSFFAEFESLRRSAIGGWRKWVPRNKSEAFYLSLMNLGTHLENMSHIARRGWYFPDNPLTTALYGAILGLLREGVNFVAGRAVELTTTSIANAALAGLVLGIPATFFFRTSERNANPRFPMTRPWFQAQMLDWEVSFYREKRWDEWLRADQIPFRLPPALESVQTIEAALRNTSFQTCGQTLHEDYTSGRYKERRDLPRRIVVPPRQL
jgi:hypothetical protein